MWASTESMATLTEESILDVTIHVILSIYDVHKIKVYKIFHKMMYSKLQPLCKKKKLFKEKASETQILYLGFLNSTK